MKFGKAKIDIMAVEAGSFCSVVYCFTALHPIDDTGYVKVVFRFAGDFGVPQFKYPQEANYCTISTNSDCRIEPRWDYKGHTRPWCKSLYLKVVGGFLNAGETITVAFGDQSRGSPGWQMQSFCEKTFKFKTFVDPFATYQFKEIKKSPTLKIIPGKPVRAICIAPSQIKKSEKFEYFIRLEDKWGNSVKKAYRKAHSGFKAAGIFKISRNCANGTRNIDCGGLQAAGSNVVFDGRRIGS